MRMLSVGEILWDVIGAQEFLGGAPLNFAASLQRLGNEVALISGVGTDPRGELAIQSVRALGLDPRFIQVIPGQATGTAVVTTCDSGNPTFEIRRPAAFDFLAIDDAVLAAFKAMRPKWAYFGTLAQTNPDSEATLARLLAGLPEAKCFYDINLRSGHWDLGLVERLSRKASIIKLNESEAEELSRLARGSEDFSLEAFCGDWSRTLGGQMMCVTLGSRGCAIWANDCLRTFPGFSVKVADTVGAGDAFAAAFMHGVDLGWPMERTASFANALGAIVCSRAGAIPLWTPEECFRLMESSR
jgi:fructokinase